jgi:hypothetical protein
MGKNSPQAYLIPVTLAGLHLSPLPLLAGDVGSQTITIFPDP